MFPCHGCTRHVRDDARQCPFCGASLRTGPSPFHGGITGGGIMGAILGLALVGCGDPDPGDEEGASTVANTSAPTDGSEGTTTGNATTNGNEAEAADYGTASPPDDTTSSTGVDTGSSTAGQEGEAADYGAPDTGIGDSMASTGTGTGTSGG